MPLGRTSLGFLRTGSDPQFIVAVLADGRYVAASRTWPGESAGIALCILNPDGTESVPDIRVNGMTWGAQDLTAVQILPDGRFVVVWDTDQWVSGSTYRDVRARIFNADGSEGAPEFRVNTTDAYFQSASSTAVLSDGRFVVTWSDSSQTGADLSGYAVRARVLNADGSESVPEFLVNATVSDDQLWSEAVALAGGRFVVTWHDDSPASGGGRKRGQAFNADGSKSGVEFSVDPDSDGQLFHSLLALEDGRFAAFYSDLFAPGAPATGGIAAWALRGRIFNADGTENVAEFLIDTATTISPYRILGVTDLGDGRFLVAWKQGAFPGGDPPYVDGTFARIFNADGTESVGRFQLDDSASEFGTVARLPDGRFVASSDTSANLFDPRVFICTAAGDTVTGGSSNDIHSGGGGDDRIDGRGGRDSLSGEAGDDTLIGGAGSDTLDGGTGVDTADYLAVTTAVKIRLDWATPFGQQVVGGVVDTDILRSIEHVITGLGSDTIYGEGSANGIASGGLNDFIDGGSGDDSIDAGDGRDLAIGGYGRDSVLGGADDDTLYGGADADTVLGGAGNDLLYGGHGGDILDGGEGTDVLFLDSADLSCTGGAGTDYIVWQDVAVAADLDITARSADFFYGWSGNDVVTANGATVRPEMHGGGGDDTLSGAASVGSILVGGDGADRLVGGTGTDHMRGDAGADAFVVAPGGGTDYVYDFGSGGADKVVLTGIPGVASFASLAVNSAYAASGWYGYGHGSGTIWLNTAGIGGRAPTAADFLFV